jgi:hypothetical protein
MKGMSLEITEELIARQTPEAQAIIRALLAKIQELQDRLNQSPRNSSSPPSTEHPHAKSPRLQPGPRADGVVNLATPGMSARSSLRDSATRSSP